MRPNEIWVADITYVETEEGACCLSLITDAYSHKIVGWALGPTLETIYPLSPADGPRDNRREYGGPSDPPLGQGMPVLQRRLCVGTEEARDRHQLDLERRPSRERRGGTRQRHTEDGMAVQDEHSHPRGMPVRTGADHRLLQHREATHEHRDADTGGGVHAVRNPAAMLEKPKIQDRSAARPAPSPLPLDFCSACAPDSSEDRPNGYSLQTETTGNGNRDIHRACRRG